MNIALDKWIEGMVPGECSVMGIPMLELTYGHMVLMERMMCFPVSNEWDIVHCILICNKNYEDGYDYINYWRTKHAKVVTELLGHIRKDPVKWSNKCLEYFDFHTKIMETMKKQGTDNPSKQIGSPFLAIIRVIAISKLGYNPLTIKDAPFSPLLLDIQTHAELEGRVEIGGGSAVADAIAQLERRSKNVSK